MGAVYNDTSEKKLRTEEKDMDIHLYSREEGSGFPLILLHGNSESGEYFQKQISYFGRQYRVIAPDTRGHGRSPRGNRPFSIRQFAEDLKDFMDEKGIEKAHLLGFSDGGNIALIFALHYPERVDHLILNGANLDVSGLKASFRIPASAAWRITSAVAGLEDMGIKSSLVHRAKKSAELLGLMIKDPALRQEDLSGNTNPDFVRMKKLVIAGSRDIIRDEETRRIYAGLPNAEIRILKGPHSIARDCAEQFNEVVDRFLRS